MISVASTSARSMDAGSGVNLAPLIVPSQRLGTFSPSNNFTSACIRCGRATEPRNMQNICGLCAAGGPRLSAVIPVRPSPIQPYPIVKCTACRVPLRVVSLPHQNAYVLCSSCQDLHVAITKRDHRDRAALRGSSRPALPPAPGKTSCTIALTLAFTYPNLPVPPPPSVPAGGKAYTKANHREGVRRMCVRFGCCARLPPHVIGDLCEACADAASFRLPAVVAQRHVPRRITERTGPRLRESLDSVRASLFQETRHGAKDRTKGPDIENDSEVELVYPDKDVPVATEHVSVVPKSERDRPKSLGNHDVGLELVYPEDTTKNTGISSSKPQPASFPPTTLRELFKDGLHVIPTLKNHAALADRRPPRGCRVPGCNEVLPAQTCMQRCTKCSISDWKRRKLAAKDAFDRSRQPTADSLTKNASMTTNTSMEEEEVTKMLDEILDVDHSYLSPLSLSSSKSSNSEATVDHDVSPISGGESDLIEFSCSSSDTESVPDESPEPDHRPTGTREGAMSLRIRIPLLFTRLPPGSLLRKCGIKKCNIALPKDHRWKTCDACRRAQRNKYWNKRRRMLAIGTLKSPDLSCCQQRSLSRSAREIDAILALENFRPCSERHCRNRIPPPEVYQWMTCTSCRAKAQHTSCQSEIIPRFPVYQNLGALLSSFDTHLKGFVEGQIMYFRAKLHNSEGGDQTVRKPWKIDHTPMSFTFVGEYSIVTGPRADKERSGHGRDHPKWSGKPTELKAMRREVSGVVLDLERILRTKFRAGEAFATDKGGIVTRSTCSLELRTQLYPLGTAVDPSLGMLSSGLDAKANTGKSKEKPSTEKESPGPSGVPLLKRFSGELEVVVVPDESHLLFRGRRTVARYSMVG